MDMKQSFTGNVETLNKYIKAYNELADKLEELGAGDEIFDMLSTVCTLSMNIY